MSIIAVTSMSPSTKLVKQSRSCIESWLSLGLEVVSLQHRREMDAVKRISTDVIVLETSETSEKVFGRPYPRISGLFNWAVKQRQPSLLINSDILLRTTPELLAKCVDFTSNGGLCCFIWHNYKDTIEDAKRERWGIDGFLFDGRKVSEIPDSLVMSIGQPWWDFWVPQHFLNEGRELCMVESPVAFHHSHKLAWSQNSWYLCGTEFARLVQKWPTDTSYHGFRKWSVDIRIGFDKQRRLVL